ncbi:MAG: PQQ-dependent sugar dehydrogenase [Anaerolineales bacterium]|nr:PQQ-dependent sugar dehydrogenase [Anaerolineales bacterium]
MKRILACIVFCAALGLAACQSNVAPPALPTPTAAPTSTPVDVSSLPTPQVAPSRTPSPMPTPTETAVPSTATAVPTITATPTETPIPVNPVSSISLRRVTDYWFVQPTYLTHAGDTRLFVVEKQGVIRIIQDGQVLPEPFLYIVSRVQSTEYEQGLLSVAFHPDYANNGFFFVNYTGIGGKTVVSRFQVSDNPNVADHGSEQVLLVIEQPYANHNGGQLQFGPDGYLYVGTGDGGAANDPLGAGQRLDILLGKILRLDVDFNPGAYAIPADNPFVTNPAALDEIWAYGLRNPWRFSFDRLTGDLFIADVGQNLWEEVNFQPANSAGGLNYGWNIMEATHCFLAESCDTRRAVLPIFEYGHENGCSVTGGYMYRGTAFPELWGNYFVGDFCSSNIWGLTPSGNGTWQARLVNDVGDGQISSFGEDVNGELYVVDNVGRILAIEPAQP